MTPRNKRERYAELQLNPEPALAIDNFHPTSEAVSRDPLIETQVMVTLDQLKPYDRNPRKSRNPKYEEIKESIRSRGLDNKPNITRRPGDSHYMIVSGGNTRLAILNELWQETGDEDFYRLTCLFVPWRGEIFAMTGHLIENDARGEMTFIDRALAIQDLQRLFEAEANEKLSLRALSAQLAESGYSASPSHISRMYYSLEHLYPALPITLAEGLGKHQIERLIKLRNGLQKAFTQFDANEDVFRLAFTGVLAEHDMGIEAWDIQRVQDTLTAKLAGLLGLSLNRFALEVDAALAGRAAVVEGESDLPAPGLWPAAQPSPSRSADTPAGADPATATPPRPDRADTEGVPPAPSADRRQPPSAEPAPAPAARPTASLAELRRQNFQLVQAFARLLHFEHLVFPCNNLNGFLVDVPATDTLFDELIAAGGSPAACQWWWLLFGLSDLVTISQNFAPFMPMHSRADVEPDPRLVNLNALFDAWSASDASPSVFFEQCRARAGQTLPDAALLQLVAPQLVFSAIPAPLYEQVVQLIEGVRRCQDLRPQDRKDWLFGYSNA